MSLVLKATDFSVLLLFDSSTTNSTREKTSLDFYLTVFSPPKRSSTRLRAYCCKSLRSR